MESITTVKLRRSTKSALNHLKGESESYDAAIKRLISAANDKHLKEKLIEGYSRMGQKELDILEEWGQTSNELDDYA